MSEHIKLPYKLILGCLCITWLCASVADVVVDTGQSHCYEQSIKKPCSDLEQSFWGQDAQYQSTQPAYRDNGDGTVSDLNTGLMWTKAVDAKKLSPEQARQHAAGMTLAGHDDWRVPTIKELYSLIDFRGYTGFDGSRNMNKVPSNAIPFINTDYFDFAYGNTHYGERYIDAQWLSSTHYVSTTMDNMETVFGVNFADGRIKGYGYKRLGSSQARKTFYVRYVRGKSYGENNFRDNGNGTVDDLSSGLSWQKADSGRAMSWKQALGYCETLEIAGFSDWRLPNIKELQYLVDYRRSPDTTRSAAINPVFQTSEIENEAGQKDYPFFWSSTTHLDGPNPGGDAAYVAFGRAIGQMRGRVMDVHGAGAQRSDPKNGQAQLGHGPQGDARRGKNHVRCVRGGTVENDLSAQVVSPNNAYPNTIHIVNVLDGSIESQKPPAMRKSPGNGLPAPQGPAHGKRPPAMGPASMGGFVERLDRDADKRVSREEFDGPPDRFDFHDSNRDGYLTEEEAPQMPPPDRRPGRW